MELELFNYLFEKWKARELRYQKLGKRKYLHFDRYIAFHKNIQFFKTYFRAAVKNIPRHSFYPFIKSDIISPRIKHLKDAATGKKKIVKRTKVRPISYATHFDSFIYSWYSTVLTHFYERKIDQLGINDCVLAYLEKGKSNIDFANEVFQFVIERSKSAQTSAVMAFDLSSFFDGLDHELLKEKWCKVLDVADNRLPKDHFTVYKSITDYTFVNKEDVEIHFPIPLGKHTLIDRFCSPAQFRESLSKGFINNNPNFNKLENSLRFGKKCGIPQGSPLSACLSNIYLIDFDVCLNEAAKAKGALYRRYCDDLIIVCDEAERESFHKLVVESVKRCEVILNQDKSELTIFRANQIGECRGYAIDGKYKNLQYLGFEFNGQNTYIRSSSMSRYSRRMSSKVRQAVFDAYDEDFGQQDFIFRKRLLQRFTNRGSKNFITYAKKAILKMSNSPTIKKQVKNSVEKIENLLVKEKKAVKEALAREGKFIEREKT
jgi:RNA-directed DNA polymerase